jgi:hypothetical protein
MRWARHVAGVGEMGNIYNILVVDVGVDGRMILNGS